MFWNIRSKSFRKVVLTSECRSAKYRGFAMSFSIRWPSPPAIQQGPFAHTVWTTRRHDFLRWSIVIEPEGFAASPLSCCFPSRKLRNFVVFKGKTFRRRRQRRRWQQRRDECTLFGQRKKKQNYRGDRALPRSIVVVGCCSSKVQGGVEYLVRGTGTLMIFPGFRCLEKRKFRGSGSENVNHISPENFRSI